VTWRGRLLGGYSSNELRTYVFPLYTPRGVLVLQEAPADHPHHQGISAGAELDGNDLWNAGSFGLPRHRQELAAKLTDIEASVTDRHVAFGHDVRWTTAEGHELLKERRTVRLGAADECTVVEWRSTFSHPQKATRFGQTKESGLGVRVPPHWETRFGGRIRDAQGRLGEAGCFDQSSPWLSIEGGAGSEVRAGVVLVPESEPCPWFTRDYGVHIYNPARHRAIDLAPGEEMTWSFRVLAYDGARSVAEIDRLAAA
jgi:hypothetical protein